MKKKVFCFLLITFLVLPISAQITGILKGRILDVSSMKKVSNSKISLYKNQISGLSNHEGNFYIGDIPIGIYLVTISKTGYKTKKLSISVEEKSQIVDLGDILLEKSVNQINNNTYILLSDADIFENDNGETNTITGLLTSFKDLFFRTVSYEFSSAFFKQRGLGNEYTEIAINGTKINKIYNGRPQWSNWGGLNDVLRNQEFHANMESSRYSFGSLVGSTNLITRASGQPKGLKISFASSNRNYRGRIMATYNSGMMKNDWAISVSASKRYAKQGYREGTLYDANSFFLAVEKKINESHRVNFTGIYASNTRGKSSPITNEVDELKGNKYNSFWGKQSGEIRNSRQRKIEEPILQLNHFWKINQNTNLQTNVTYQFGKVGNSRIDYGGSRIVEDSGGNPIIIGGGANPDPSYYQKLPSYFLRNIEAPDYENAYLAEQEFLKNGQINWLELYESNILSTENGGNSIYAFYEDRNDDKQLIINSIFSKSISKKLKFSISFSYQNLKSENFARMLDLLGGNGFLDVDFYADNIDEAQNDLRNPNRIVLNNEKFKYNFIIDATFLNGYSQVKYKTKRTESFLSINYKSTTYQRNGLYENGAFPGIASFGKSNRVNFQNFGIKGGYLFKLSGRHIFSANLTSANTAPNIRNSFSNPRENNEIVQDLKAKNILAFDINYNARLPFINAKVSAYGINIKNQTEVSFYFADGLTGLNNAESTAFVQEVLTGVETTNFGVELAFEIPIYEGLKFKTVASVGQSIYNNNPDLYLTSDDFTEPIEYGEVFLKNYYVSNGPQQAYSAGFEYFSPHYWWVGLTGNYFNNAFINIAPITRTKNFYLDSDGLPINDFDEETAKKLLEQEKFKSYYLFNVVGGKSWKIDNYYFGFFANISNLLNSKYKTGGFEQSRNANYNTLLEDYSRDKPLFGPKYWFGYGTSYYISLYFRM